MPQDKEKFLGWFLRHSAFLLAICVLSGLVAGWFLPGDEQFVESAAIGQIIMAIVVGIQEGWKLYGRTAAEKYNQK